MMTDRRENHDEDGKPMGEMIIQVVQIFMITLTLIALIAWLIILHIKGKDDD